MHPASRGAPEQWGDPMARYEWEHEDERGHYGDWRDDEARQHRLSGRGREPGEGREHHFSRFDDAYSQARGTGYRDRNMSDTGDRRRSHGGDWDTEYGRPADWAPRQAQPRDYGQRDYGSDYSRSPDWSPAHQPRYGSWEGGRARWQRDPSIDGPFVGRGPRGYRRSDDRIKEDVSEILTIHGRVDASDIDVHVDQGVVTLEGSIDSRPMKRLVEDIIDNVPGVRDIRNELRIASWDEESSRGGYAGSSTLRGWSDDRSLGERHDDQHRPVNDRVADRPSFAGSGGESEAQPEEGRFMSSGGSEYRERMRENMDVVGADGEVVGGVKEISNNSFLMNRPMHRDLFVPFSAIRSMSGNRVTLSVQANEVDDQGWATPGLMGSSTGKSER
jgi:hypothetical protein